MGKAGRVFTGVCLMGALVAVQVAMGMGKGSPGPALLDATHVSLDLSAVVGEARIAGLPEAILAAAGDGSLRLYSHDADWADPSFPAVAGRWSAEGGIARFTPRHPLISGEAYRLVIELDGWGRPAELEATVPAPVDGAGAEVVAVYPSGAVLPENQLKLYVHFSEPMHRWDPYDHLRLIDLTTGAPVEAAFHAMRDGLWDAQGTRFTAVFDPGRVKRGLANNEELGAPLVAGHQYRLEVSERWLASSGEALGAVFTKDFSASNADRARPVPRTWKVEPPASSGGPVTLDFTESMDRALLARMLWVRGPDGDDVSVEVSIEADESRWRAAPHAAWAEGDHLIVVDCRVEDLAGNNVERLFDVDLSEDGPMGPLDAMADAEDCAVKIPFTVTLDTSRPEAQAQEEVGP